MTATDRPEFQGRTALVTGGGSGIGRAVALMLGGRGASVVVNDVDPRAAREVAGEIAAAGGTAMAAVGDASEPEDVKAAVDAAVREYGALHLAFNNAGVRGPHGTVSEVGIEDYRRLIETNLNSVFYAMHYEIPEMLRAGGGSIVNTSSVLGVVGKASSAAYVTAKHGVTGMTKAAALGYADRGIRVNSVQPGYIETALLENLPRHEHESLVGQHPAGRLGTPEEVAEVVGFLLSSRAAFVTGAQYAVDGGYTTR